MRRRGRRACKFFCDPRSFERVLFASRMSEERGGGGAWRRRISQIAKLTPMGNTDQEV